MFRVLIVDDEPIIRNGIKTFVPWEREGFTVEADCANGLEALEVLRTTPVDILVTDIKMPLMNGIQLMEEALQMNPALKVVLISSYNDFDYVRKGLRLGAVDYLLKPTLEAEELLAVLHRCRKLIEEDLKKISEQEQWSRGVRAIERKRQEQEIKRLIAQERSHNTVSQSLEWLNNPYVYAYITFDGLKELQETHGHVHVGFLYEELQGVFYALHEEGVALVVAGEGLFIIFPEDQDCLEALTSYKEQVSSALGLTVTIGYGIGQGAEFVRAGLNRSRTAAQQSFYDGRGNIYAWKEEAESAFRGMGEYISTSERMYDRSQAVAEVRLHAEKWRSGSLTPAQVRNEACLLLSAMAPFQADTAILPELLDMLKSTETLDQLVTMLLRIAEDTERPAVLKLTDKGHSGKLIAKAIEYIKAHYTEEITLQQVADAVHVSKSYFSLLFKKGTGHNFIDYLIELRIREAKRLLADSEYKIYEVAQQSGFKDVKYFSKLFKKMTQLTPVEFREQHQGRAEESL